MLGDNQLYWMTFRMYLFWTSWNLVLNWCWCLFTVGSRRETANNPFAFPCLELVSEPCHDFTLYTSPLPQKHERQLHHNNNPKLCLSISVSAGFAMAHWHPDITDGRLHLWFSLRYRENWF